MNEIHRLAKVIDQHLAAREDENPGHHPVLVGSKVTYADLIFVLYHEQLQYIFAGFTDRWNVDNYPSYKRWIEGLKG